MLYGRIQDGVVVEVVDLPVGVDPADRYHPSLDFRPLPEGGGAGWVVDGAAIVAPPEPEPMSPAQLEAFKQALKTFIDAAAEAERLKYITPGSGQAMTYARKVEEAKMADAEANPIAADYPLLAASLGIDGATIADVANLVLAMDEAWTLIGAAIEAARLSTKAAIDGAANEAAAQAAADAVEWPSP